MKNQRMNLKTELEKYPFLSNWTKISRETGINVYLIGGFVRDILLERIHKKPEMDFLVMGDSEVYAKRICETLNGSGFTVYKNFGTAHFHSADWNFEFVSARRESYSRESRNPLVTSGTFEDDILRRDFTINALAVSLNTDSFGELIDLTGGLKDLENKILRTPLDPEMTFDDDPLRIMRAFRFAAQLNFQPHESIFPAAHKMRERLSIISQERVTDEFLKIMESDYPSIGLILMYRTGVLNIVFPELARLGGVDQRKEYHHKDVFYHTCDVLDNLCRVSNNLWLRMATLLHDIGKPVTKRFYEGTGWTFHGHEEVGARMIEGIFKRMKMPLHKAEYVTKLVRLHQRPMALAEESVTDSAIRRLIVDAGEDLNDLISLCRADITSKNREKVNKYLENYNTVMERVYEVQEKDRLRAFQSPVRGDIIMKDLGLKPGKSVGIIKKAIEEAILDGVIPNEYDAAYAYMMEHKEEILRKSGI